ncbi:DUF1405 domain-containing protein [Candidatus Micrarchaeota archaeon]|nr:DUF1405 domain-containing protein [Candidatus Micrarchaeota archaeon]
MGGFAFGLWYYAPQLSRSNPVFWLVVLDSPLSVLLAAIVLLLALKGVKNPLLNFLAGLSCFKYGVWTLFVLVYFNEFFFSPENALLYAAMFVTHVGMVVQGLFFAGLNKPGVALAAVGAWLFANDFFDYFLGTHTALPDVPEKVFVTAVFSFAFTAFVIVLFYFLAKRRANIFTASGFLTRARSLLE